MGMLPGHADTIHAVLGPLLPPGSRVALFDFPAHSNVGDSAIWLGEEQYLRDLCRAKVVAVEAALAPERALPRLPARTIVLIHGGGNLGDLWPVHQAFRERLVAAYPEHRVIQLPQSIHFDDPGTFAASRQIFSRHRDFHLLVRDRDSEQLGRQLHDGPTLLCPDMALCLGPLRRHRDPDRPLLALLRSDKEKRPAAAVCDAPPDLHVVDWVTEPPSRVRRLTLRLEWLQSRVACCQGLFYPLKRRLYRHLARQRLLRGCELLGTGRVVITDRLHAHLLCTLLGIPHVVLDNSYGKIARFRAAWQSGAGLCETAETLSEAVAKARRLLSTAG